MKTKLIIIFSLFFYPNFSNAQHLLELSQMDKLPVNAIHRIFRDSEGYAWYATIDGLCRDDGYNIQMFRSDSYSVLRSNYVTGIVEDNQKRIWIGTTKGAYILDKKNYRMHALNYFKIKDEKVVSLCAASDGSVWVGMLGHLLQFSPDESLRSTYPIRIKHKEKEVRYICEDKHGDLLLSIENRGICKLNQKKRCITEYAAVPFPNWILRDKGQKYYWLATWGDGVVRFDPEASPDSACVYQPLPINKKGEISPLVISIAQDDIFNYLWVVTLTNLFVFRITEQGMLEQIETSPFLSQDDKMLTKVIKDNEGDLWVSAFDRKSFIIGGFRDNTIEEYRIPDLKQKINLTPAITTFCKGEDGVLWLSLDRIGLCLYSTKSNKLVKYKDCRETRDLPIQYITSLMKSREKGKVWLLSASSNIIYKLKHEDLSLKVDETINLEENIDRIGYIETIYEDNSENLWISTTYGLFVYNLKKKQLKTINGIQATISDITQTNDGTIWACARNKGIFKIQGQNYVLYPLNRDLLCLDASPDGKLWLGTGEGKIFCFDSHNKEPYKDYSSICGMNGDLVNDIVVDKYNHLWIATNQSLKEFNPINKAYRSHSTSDQRLFLKRFLPHSVFKDIDGKIYFGGIPGIIVITPSQRLAGIPRQVKTLITNVKILGESVIFGDRGVKGEKNKIQITPNDRNVEIEFSSLDFWNASHIRYAYRLKGVDKDWIYLKEGKNSAFYNQLAKGEYIFQVKATDKNGLWSNQITELTLERLPAFYETWWAYTCYWIIILSTMWSIIYLYLQRVKKNNEKEVTEKISQMKLKYFTNVSHDLLTPLTTITCLTDEMAQSEYTDKKLLNVLQANIKRLRRLIQQVLDFKKIENGAMKLNVAYHELVQFVCNISETGFLPIIEKKKIQYSFSASSERIDGYFDADKLDKILFNLLSNALKYTPENKSVGLILSTYERDSHNYLRIEVKDEGIGIPLKEQADIFVRFYNNKEAVAGMSNGIGLSLTKELVELHHGKIFMESQPAKGSTFTVEIPIDKASYSNTELCEETTVVSIESPFTDKSMMEERVESSPCSKSAYKLLLVEDNEDLLTAMQRLFSKLYHVYIAKNGCEGLAIIEENDIDVVISDIMMPKMDGLSLCETIKNDIAISHVIVILLTAKTQVEDKIDSYRAGADAYVGKPFDMDVLQVQLENLLCNRERRQQNFKQNTRVEIAALEIPNLDEQLLERAVRAVEANLDQPDFDVTTLAGLLNMSRSSLVRKLKVIIGQTPLEFIRNIKLKHACAMLENKQMSISEIVSALGYNDHKYFTKSFKEEFGLTPSDYRKKTST